MLRSHWKFIPSSPDHMSLTKHRAAKVSGISQLTDSMRDVKIMTPAQGLHAPCHAPLVFWESIELEGQVNDTLDNTADSA